MTSFSTSNSKNELIGKILKKTSGSLKWKVNLPKKLNYDNVYLYRDMKKFFKAPCMDLASDTLPMSYKGGHYQARTTLLHTEARLKYANELSDKKRIDLTRQWKELEDKETELKNNFIEFNSFLLSNAQKRKRAEQKYKEKKAQKMQKTEDIRLMSTNIELMRTTAQKMQINIAKSDIYEKFLRLAMRHSDFKDILSIIKRYTLLDETKMDDVKKTEQIYEAFHEKQLIYTTKVHEFQVFYLQFSTELSELRHRYDTAKSKTHAWERVMENICNRYTQIAQDINWVGMAIRHLFEVAHYRLKEGHKKKISMDKLAHINSSLKALEEIKEQLTRLHQQKYADTSMAGITYDISVAAKRDVSVGEESAPSFGQPVSRPELNPDNLPKMWVKKVVKRDLPPDKPNEDEMDAFLAKTFKIKLSPAIYKKAKVKDFEKLYRRALMGIQKQKLANIVGGFKAVADISKESDEVSVASSALRKNKWAIAALAAKLAESDVSGISPLPPVPVASTNVLTLLEDGEEDDDRRGKIWLDRKSEKIKAIEKKFDKEVGTLYKEFSEKEKERPQMLPPIYRAKEQDSIRLFTNKQDAYYSTHSTTSRNKGLGHMGVKRAKRLPGSTELPHIHDMDGNYKSQRLHTRE